MMMKKQNKNNEKRKFLSEFDKKKKEANPAAVIVKSQLRNPYPKTGKLLILKCKDTLVTCQEISGHQEFLETG